MRGPPGAILLSVLLLGAGFLLMPDASAERTPVMASVLPTPRDGVATAAADDAIYLFGGDSADGRLRSILRYDPIADSIATQAAELPTGRSGSAVVWTGTHFYLFGGWTTSGYTDQVLRYDPAADTLTVMVATLPSARVHLAAAWVDGAAYLYGGSTNCSPCETNEILRYDPGSDSMSVLTETLPSRRAALAAATDGERVYLFGGVSASPFQAFKDVLVHDPAAATVGTAAPELSSGRYHLSAQWAEGRAWVLGGTPCVNNTYCETILGFDPVGDALEASEVLLQTGRHRTGSAMLGGHVYLVGGHDGARLDEILRFSPPGAPPPVQEPPVLAAIEDENTRVGAELIVSVSATHPQNKPVTLTADPKPAGATFTDLGGGQGELVWTPQAGDEGTHDVTVHASDGTLTDTESFTIQVDPEDAPFVTAIADRVAEVGDRVLVAVEAWDPEDRPIALTIDPVPSGATFTDHGNGTATFDWSTEPGQNGTWDFLVTATADGKTGTESFQIGVRNAILPPELDPLDPVRAIAGQENLFPVTATHPEGDPIVLSANGLPAGATFTDHGDGTGEVAWDPLPNQLGAHAVEIVAATADRTVSGTLSIQAMLERDFRITALTAIHQVTSPGEVLSLPAKVENTGNQSLTLDLTTHAIQTKGFGWTLSVTPASVTLDSGASTTVLMNVTATASSVQVQARLRGTATDDASLTRVQNHIVKVPIHIEIILAEEIALADGAAEGLGGEVHLSWENGAPAIGRSVEVRQTPAAAPALATSESGSSGGDGRFGFDFRGDPRAILPGLHDVIVTVTRSGETDTAETAYTVQPA